MPPSADRDSERTESAFGLAGIIGVRHCYHLQTITVQPMGKRKITPNGEIGCLAEAQPIVMGNAKGAVGKNLEKIAHLIWSCEALDGVL